MVEIRDESEQPASWPFSISLSSETCGKDVVRRRALDLVETLRPTRWEVWLSWDARGRQSACEVGIEDCGYALGTLWIDVRNELVDKIPDLDDDIYPEGPGYEWAIAEALYKATCRNLCVPVELVRRIAPLGDCVSEFWHCDVIEKQAKLRGVEPQFNFEDARRIAATASSAHEWYPDGMDVAECGWENEYVYGVQVREVGGPVVDGPNLLLGKYTGGLYLRHSYSYRMDPLEGVGKPLAATSPSVEAGAALSDVLHRRGAAELFDDAFLGGRDDTLAAIDPELDVDPWSE